MCNIFREDSITNVQNKNKPDILAKANESMSSHVCRPKIIIIEDSSAREEEGVKNKSTLYWATHANHRE